SLGPRFARPGWGSARLRSYRPASRAAGRRPRLASIRHRFASIRDRFKPGFAWSQLARPRPGIAGLRARPEEYRVAWLRPGIARHRYARLRFPRAAAPVFVGKNHAAWAGPWRFPPNSRAARSISRMIRLQSG